ncbi:MAG: MFS transporter [Planctomycetota bacterium]
MSTQTNDAPAATQVGYAATRPASGVALFVQQVRGLPANFWYANIMEMFERLAFFSVLAMRGLFVVAAVTEHGLGLNYTQKGIVFGVWAALQCFLPMVTGGYTDRYGYRKSLAVAFTINVGGYLLMGWSWALADALGGGGFWIFLAAACLVGTGTAIFKPPIQGTIARATNEQTSSLGWGLFYWVVNIGGFLAPMTAATLRGTTDWSYVFYFAAGATALNFLPAFLLYREPERSAEELAAQRDKDPLEVFVSSIATLVKDLRLLAFLLIFSCFWLMFQQLFDLLPNLIDEWVDTAPLADLVGRINPAWITAGQVKPEVIVNIDAASIVLLVIPISWLISRLNKVVAMLIGMVIALVGFFGAGTSVGWICCVMIFIFAIGEMVCSPTFSAYIGLIAPRDKKALYMGYSQMPFAIGWALGSFIGNVSYEHYGSKATLAERYMVQHMQVAPAFAAGLPSGREFESLVYLQHGGTLEALSQTAERAAAEKQAGQTERAAAAWKDLFDPLSPALRRSTTDLLWRSYNPQYVWYALGGIGLLGTLGMFLFYLLTPKPAAAGGGA